MTDAELTARFRSGDSGAFEALLSANKAAVYSYLLALLRDENAASDVFQETFIKVFKNLDKYEEEGKFRQWVLRLARNGALDYLRKSGLEAARMQTLESDEETQMAKREIASRDETPEQAVSRKWDREKIAAAIGRLSPEQREVFLLRENSGLSFKEIARVMECPLGTALARMSRAVKKLQETAGEYEL